MTVNVLGMHATGSDDVARESIFLFVSVLLYDLRSCFPWFFLKGLHEWKFAQTWISPRRNTSYEKKNERVVFRVSEFYNRNVRD
jgi:hypothetical protein